MPSQVVYETNADWNASYEAMAKNPLVVAEPTKKGLLWFKFKENQTVFQLSSMGKLQVKWTDVSEKKTLFRLIKNLLVAKSNENLRITPQKQQVWIEYPVPDSFKLYWCDEVTEFEKKRLRRLPETNQRAEIKPTEPYAPKKGIWDPPPDFSFSPNYEEAHRKKREALDAEPIGKVQFPQVPFHWRNWSPYQLKVRLEVRVVLGGRNRGLIEDRKGYYNGEAYILVEPYRGGIRDGCFTLPQDCTRIIEETTIEVRARILDQNDPSKKEYTIIKSWTYNPKEKEWFHEPKAFTEDLPGSNERMSSWESLKKALAEIGGYLTDIEVEKRRSGETFDKITVQGIMMLAGAKTMQAAAKIYVPDEYEGFLFTQASVNEGDELTWQGKNYTVRKVEEIYDAYVVSYRIAKLAKPPLEIKPAWVLG